MTQILSSVSCSLVVRIVSRFLFKFLKIYFVDFTLFGFSLFYQALNIFIYFLLLIVFSSISSIDIDFPNKDFYIKAIMR